MTYVCNQSEPFEQYFVGDHPGTIPVEFGKIPISGIRAEVVCSFPYIIHCKTVPLQNFTVLSVHFQCIVSVLPVCFQYIASLLVAYCQT